MAQSDQIGKELWNWHSYPGLLAAQYSGLLCLHRPGLWKEETHHSLAGLHSAPQTQGKLTSFTEKCTLKNLGNFLHPDHLGQ
jgi:hypothetical protein